MYVAPDEVDREVREIRRIVAEAVGPRDERDDRNCSRTGELLPAPGKPARPAPPDGMMPAPPL